jgi:hypothetical protein
LDDQSEYAAGNITIGRNLLESSYNQTINLNAKTKVLNHSFTASNALITGGQTLGTASFIGLVSSASYVQIFTGGTGVWVKPSWAQTVTVIAIGGGGSGGGGYYSGVSEPGFKTGGGGGGGGEILIHTYNASSLPETVSYQVGSGGPGVGTNTNGNPGGFTRFGSTGVTTYRVLESRGGYGGFAGIRLGDANQTTFLSNTIPSSILSTGAGGGGAGVSNPTSSWGLGSNALRWSDASDLPYTPFDAIRMPFTGSGAEFNYFTSATSGYSIQGIPAPFAPTGGGGGTGVSGSTNTPYATTGAIGTGKGGGILNANTKTGGIMIRGSFTVSTNGVINNAVAQPRTTSTVTSVPGFYQFITVGLGGRGGNAQNSPSAILPVSGGLYGGGGGGGGWNRGSAPGGAGVLVVISEA